MKSGPDRKYTSAFRQAAVQRVEAGRSVRAVARSLEMSPWTLTNCVHRAGQALAPSKASGKAPVTELEAELSRLRAENARLKVEKEILKNRPRALPRPICIETQGR
jgi:transposase